MTDECPLHKLKLNNDCVQDTGESTICTGGCIKMTAGEAPAVILSTVHDTFNTNEFIEAVNTELDTDVLILETDQVITDMDIKEIDL